MLKKFGKKKKSSSSQSPQTPPAASDDAQYDEWIVHSSDASKATPQQSDQAAALEEGYEPVDDGQDIFGFDKKSPTKSSAPSWSKPKTPTSPKQLVVEDTYDGFEEDSSGTAKSPPVMIEDTYDGFEEDSSVGAKSPPVKVEDTYDGFEDENNVPPSPQVIVQDTYDGFDDDGAMEYEDVESSGDIFGHGSKKPPEVRGTPPTKRPVSMQVPSAAKGAPPKGRPLSVQNPPSQQRPYQNIPQKGQPQSQPKHYQNISSSTSAPYQNVPTSSPNDEYETMDPLEDGGSYEDIDPEAVERDMRKPPAPPPPDCEYEEMEPEELDSKKRTSTVTERQKQLQQTQEVQQASKQAPKKKGLALDYQKIKFDMVTKKFQEMGTEEKKTTSPSTLRKQVPPKTQGVGTVGSMTRNFQQTKKAGATSVTIKGYLWHKPPARGKYHEEYCELVDDTLKMYKNKNDSSPSLTIDISKCTMAVASEEWERKNVFKLTAGASVDYFGAFNATEMNSWMEALKPVTLQQ